MKKNLLLILMLVMSIGLFAQDWAPINTTEKFCYSSDDTLDIINNVLWVDSVKTWNGHEVYYMNKIVKLFDEDQNHYMFDEPQFLADTIIISEEGSWEFGDVFPFPDDGGFVIYPYEELGFQWSFLSGISAEIVSIDTMSVFGEIDSVKVISLTNNQQIILSKEHGILNWLNEYHLVGIEGRDLGLNVLKFDGLFKKVSPGDILCVESIETQADDGYVEQHHIKKRQKVLEIQKYYDSVIMLVESYYYASHDWGSTTTYNNGSHVSELKYFRNDSTDIYPNTTLNYSWENNSSINGKTISKIASHEFGGIKKTQIIFEGEWWQSSVFEECEDLYPRILCPKNDEMALVEYSENYGVIESRLGFFEYWYQSKLVGVIDNGDTLGTIFPMDIFVGIKHTMSPDWRIYPSPAKESLKIQTQETGEIYYQVFNISGQLALEGRGKKSSEDLEIDISELQNGVYILQLKMDQQLIQKKFVKQN